MNQKRGLSHGLEGSLGIERCPNLPLNDDEIFSKHPSLRPQLDWHQRPRNWPRSLRLHATSPSSSTTISPAKTKPPAMPSPICIRNPRSRCRSRQSGAPGPSIVLRSPSARRSLHSGVLPLRKDRRTDYWRFSTGVPWTCPSQRASSSPKRRRPTHSSSTAARRASTASSVMITFEHHVEIHRRHLQQCSRQIFKMSS